MNSRWLSRVQVNLVENKILQTVNGGGRRCVFIGNLSLSRISSAIIAFVYIVGAYFIEDSETAFQIAIYLLLPLACIWFSEDIGSYKGILTSVPVRESTPGCFIAFGGWLLLFLPIVTVLISAYFS